MTWMGCIALWILELRLKSTVATRGTDDRRQKQNARRTAGVFAGDPASSGSLAGVVPGNPVDVAAGDADIGQFAVGQAIELREPLVVAPPFAVPAGEGGEQHGVGPFSSE